MAKIYKVNGNEYEVSVNSLIGNRAEVTVNGVRYQVEISDTKPAESTYESEKRPSRVNVEGKKRIKSPLPGVIVALKVKPGDVVKSGQTVAVLEAMKMENEIQSEYDGVILSVDVNQGDSLLEGDTIVTIG